MPRVKKPGHDAPVFALTGGISIAWWGNHGSWLELWIKNEFYFFYYKKGINEYELERHFGDARVGGGFAPPTQNRSRVNELWLRQLNNENESISNPNPQGTINHADTNRNPRLDFKNQVEVEAPAAIG